MLTWIRRLPFKCPVGDFHCGLRGFRRDAFLRMGLRTTGMEFASEMVIKATLMKLRISEVPTTLSPDGRSRPPHLRPWRDGWRHLRFMLLFSPRWLFWLPGLAMLSGALAPYLPLLAGPLRLGRVDLDVHSLLYAQAGVTTAHEGATHAGEIEIMKRATAGGANIIDVVAYPFIADLDEAGHQNFLADARKSGIDAGELFVRGEHALVGLDRRRRVLRKLLLVLRLQARQHETEIILLCSICPATRHHFVDVAPQLLATPQNDEALDHIREARIQSSKTIRFCSTCPSPALATLMIHGCR